MIREQFLPEYCYSSNTVDEVLCIVIHHISAKYTRPDDKYDVDAIIDIFKKYKVSAHYLITRTGRIINLVPEEMQAWHAGKSEWRGMSGCNRFSLGVELVGCDEEEYTDAQYASLTYLLAKLLWRYGLTVDEVTGHRDIAPKRKTDPNKTFDWKRIRATLDNINYEPEVFDDEG